MKVMEEGLWIGKLKMDEGSRVSGTVEVFDWMELQEEELLEEEGQGRLLVYAGEAEMQVCLMMGNQSLSLSYWYMKIYSFTVTYKLSLIQLTIVIKWFFYYDL